MNRGHRAARARQRHFGVLCVLSYVVLSWAVRFDMRHGKQIASLLYPLDTFSMYAEAPGAEMSHLLIRDAHGAVHRVTDFTSFDCIEPVGGNGAQCSERPGIQYLSEDLTNHMRSHAGSGDAAVELIVRTWQIRSGAAPLQTPDCVVAHCKVSR